VLHRSAFIFIGSGIHCRTFEPCRLTWRNWLLSPSTLQLVGTIAHWTMHLNDRSRCQAAVEIALKRAFTQLGAERYWFSTDRQKFHLIPPTAKCDYWPLNLVDHTLLGCQMTGLPGCVPCWRSNSLDVMDTGLISESSRVGDEGNHCHVPDNHSSGTSPGKKLTPVRLTNSP
jgi:hypothetical protein